LGFALSRNISAVLLVLILAAQSIRLVLGVVHDKFSIQETWDSRSVNLYDALAEVYYVGSSFHINNRWARLTIITSIGG
jgi:hypothetical protein